jgi:hypothetical protein
MGPLSEAVIFAAAWVDLAQHLVRVWHWVEEILQMYDLLHVGLAKSSFALAKVSVNQWLREDQCAPLLSESEALLLARVSSDDSVVH